MKINMLVSFYDEHTVINKHSYQVVLGKTYPVSNKCCIYQRLYNVYNVGMTLFVYRERILYRGDLL